MKKHKFNPETQLKITANFQPELFDQQKEKESTLKNIAAFSIGIPVDQLKVLDIRILKTKGTIIFPNSLIAETYNEESKELKSNLKKLGL